MFTEEHKSVKLNNKKSMIDFLKNHFRYDTMRSWNRSTSYANNVKIHNLDLPDGIRETAYDIMLSDVDTIIWDIEVNEIFDEFRRETGYDIGFNGRSGGYIVLYDTEYDVTKNCSVTYPGRGIDMYEDFEDWDIDDLKERVKIVMEFDKTCDKLRDAFIDLCKTFKVTEEEITVVKTVKVLTERETKND